MNPASHEMGRGPRVWMVGHYVLQHPLTQNARHRRYQARTLGGERGVEVKVMQRRYRQLRAVSGHLGNPYIHEMRIASAAQVDGIVRHIDAGTTPTGEHYLVREWVEGITARDAIVRNVRLNVPTAIGLVVDLADALAALHEMGFVHRDLRPERILVRKRRSGYQAMITDLGSVGRIGASPEGDLIGEYVGVPAVMAPEQLLGTPPDISQDIYAIGALLFQLVTGVPPLLGVGPSNQEHRDYLASNSPIPTARPRQRVQSLPEELDVLLLKCLHRDPSQRPPGIAPLLRGLHLVLRAYAAERGKDKVPSVLWERLRR